jgi:hypothetical protein
MKTTERVIFTAIAAATVLFGTVVAQTSYKTPISHGILQTPLDGGGYAITNIATSNSTNSAASVSYVTNQIATAGTNYAPKSTTPVIVAAPATATNAGLPGQMATDGIYFYYATGTNSWGRAILNTW